MNCVSNRKHVGFTRAHGFVTGLETDGQFENIPCADDTGDHHHNGIDGGWSYGIEATLNFNIQLKALGVYQTGADAYVANDVIFGVREPLDCQL
jgi:hypothetical protein